MQGRRLPRALAAATALALLTAGCLSSGSDGGGGGGNASGKVKGSTISLWAAVDQPVLDGIKAAVDPKAKAKGITIKWQKVNNINQLIITKIQANDAPDIAWIPQPGVVKDIVKRGKATPLDFLDTASLDSSMLPGTLDAGTVDGKLYGLLVNASGKSLVFYPKKAFAAAGYKAPTSIDGLNQLTEQIKSDGTAPWCMGIGAQAATGWPVTDWFEDLIMRYGGVDGYNAWVSHETKFDSPLVRKAAAEFQRLMFTDGNVLGGRKSIASNAFTTAGNPMFDAKPGCFLFKQGSFITGFFPKDVQADVDNQVGVFGFPPATEGGDNPLLGGGDMAMLLKNTKAGQEVIKLLSDKSICAEPAKTGSYLCPHKDFGTSAYPSAISRQVAEIASGTSAFLFDGSDAMPGAVGSGTFWKDMTSWTSGQESLDDALTNIDDSWPTS